MSNFKEIVTKAVVGKAKKNSVDSFSVETEEVPNTVLGCWVINHTFNGVNNNGRVGVNGEYDINVWYSYDNDTKTAVSTKRYAYNDNINVNLKDNTGLSSSNEIIVRSLTAPSASAVEVEGNTLKLKVEKELGVEIVGDIKVKINVLDDYDDYEVDNSNVTEDINIDEEYLNKKN